MKRLTLPKNILIPEGTVVTQTFDLGLYCAEIKIDSEQATLIISEDAIRALNLLNPDVVIF